MPEDISECYGKHMLFRGVDHCPKKRSECPIGEACLSASNEQWEDIRYHKYKNISLGNVFFDPGRDSHDNEVSPAEQSALREIHEMGNTPDFCKTECGDIILEEIIIPEEARDTVLNVIEHIAGLYFSSPYSFKCLMEKIYNDKRQSDVAKAQNITRQGLNKRLLHELGIAQKRNDIQQRRDRELATAKKNLATAEERFKQQAKSLCNMTDIEKKIYQVCAEDGVLSVTAIRKITGYTRRTIYRSIHNLSLKYGISIHISPYTKRQK